MTNSTTRKSRIPTERLKETFGAFRFVFLSILVLGIGLPVLMTVIHHRHQSAHDMSLARMLMDSSTVDASAGLAGIVRRTGLTHVRVTDGAGVILGSSDPTEVGKTLGSDLLAIVDGAETGDFSVDVFADGRDVTITGLRDRLSDRAVLLSKSRRSLAESAMPPVAAGLMLSLVLCTLVAVRAWSLTAEFHDSAAVLDTLLRDALVDSSAVAPENVSRAASGGPLELIGASVAEALHRTLASERSAAAATAAMESVFDAIPHPAYIRTPDGRVAAVNRLLCDELDRQAVDLVSASESELQRAMPVDRVRMLLGRKGFRNRGITGLIVSPTSNRLTIVPVVLRGNGAHLVMLQQNEATVHSVERDSPETPRGLRMAIEIAENQSPLALRPEPVDLIASNEINSGLADLYGATDLAVWAIDENGRTLHWSRAARRLTGIWKREIPDIEAFCRMILTDEEQRQTLLRWLGSDPTRLSRQLVCRADDGVPVSLTWNADETLVRTRPGEMKRVTVLWCKSPIHHDTDLEA